MAEEMQKQILIVSDDEAFSNEVTLFFKGFDETVDYSFQSVTYEQAVRYSVEKTPTIVLLELDAHDEEIFSLTRKIANHFPHSKIVGVGSDLSVDAILRLIKFGAQDFLKLPLETEEVRSLLYQVEKAQHDSSSSSNGGTSITVLSAKGGTGVSFLTTNLAVALAKIAPKKSIAVVDMRPQCGDVSTYLNLQPEYTLRDIIDNINQIDHAFLDGVTLKHKSGVHVFASPRDDQEPLNMNCLSELREIISYLQQIYDVVLLDGCYIDELLLEAQLLHSDRVLLLGNLDVPSLKGLVSALNKFARYQFDLDQVGIVINRYNSKNRLDAKEFERKTGHSIACNLPNDYALCIDSINRGLSIFEINSNAKIATQIMDLAKMIVESEGHLSEADSEKPAIAAKKGLFGWLL